MKQVVLDTNILVSALVYKGKPKLILDLVLNKKLIASTSEILLAELIEILSKKFYLSSKDLTLIKSQVEQYFLFVSPRKSLHILKDEPDNRVLEAAVSSKSKYIITGDKELLHLSQYKDITILTPSEFLEEINEKLEHKEFN